ncbi:MAG: IS5 family transposase [Bacteroidota bacterium]|nr:IS5 family transposase [Bacteroidota bacterium]
MKHKDNRPRSFFDEHFRLEKLSQQNDPLHKLKERIHWELFRPLLNETLYKEAKGPGGCRPYDYVLMFKILILQRYYNISDDKMEFAILDRLSFMRFLGLTISDKVPDAKTIWLFREQLTKAGAIEKLFVIFNEYLNNEGLVAHEGKMVDASFVEVPIQRNTRQENKYIKKGNIPEQWKENPHKLAQKDTDARWTKKNGKNYYGYKNHIKADTKSKLIDSYVVTNASVHDSQTVEQLISEKDAGQPLHADSAYSGEPVVQAVEEKKIINQIQEKGYRNHPLSEEQKENNRHKSKIRARVEHIFGFVENSMGGLCIRTIGLTRTTAVIGLMNLTYNLFRYLQLTQLNSG